MEIRSCLPVEKSQIPPLVHRIRDLCNGMSEILNLFGGFLR